MPGNHLAPSALFHSSTWEGWEKAMVSVGHVWGGGGVKGHGVSRSHVPSPPPPPRVPRLNGKVPWERLYATHYHTLFENSLLTLPKALFTLYRMSFAPARKPYRIGLLFTHTSSDFGANSVTKRSCATLRRS